MTLFDKTTSLFDKTTTLFDILEIHLREKIPIGGLFRMMSFII